MNTDDKIRQCFHELRDEDARRAPSFSRVVRAPVPPFAVPWLRLTASVAVIAALIVALTVRRKPAVDTQRWAALSSWHATTDELLTVPGTPWGSTLKTPTDSLIENAKQINQ